MRFGSLFAGTGGFVLGLERAGMECAWQVEIDGQCNRLLARSWPSVERHRDVREVGPAELSRVDLICGGFPCQDLSVAGRRAGLAGERSGLWGEFHRVLSELRPPWTLIENVPGLLSSNQGRDFAVILRGLVELGYGVAYRILDAQYFGVPQRRRRVFIVGHLGDGRAAEVLLESEGVSGNTPPRREAGEEIAGTLGDSSQSGGFRTTDLDNSGALVFDARGHGQGDLVNTLTGDHINRVTDYTPIAVARETGKGFWTEGLPGLRAHPGRMAGNLVAYRDPMAFEPSQFGKVRRLTPTECERLQGFPDSWTDGFPDSIRYRMLGNAVCVPVAEWIGQRILECDQRAVDCSAAWPGRGGRR